jgi:hypothetical protein
VFLALGDSLYTENSFFIEQYVLRALDQYSSRLKNHALQLLLELLQENSSRGVTVLSNVLSKSQAASARASAGGMRPLWTPLVDLVEMGGDTPLPTTVVSVINAYLAALESPELRAHTRSKLQQLGWHEVLLGVRAEVEADPELKETYLEDFTNEVQAYQDFEQRENRDDETVALELQVDLTSIVSMAARIEVSF